MKPALCVALLSVGLAAFSPSDGQNDVVCRASDPTNGDHLELSTRVSKIDTLYQVVQPVRLQGQWRGQTLNRTFDASKFMMNPQIDKDGQFRLSLHSRPIEENRVKWFIREKPLSDGFTFNLPGQFGQPTLSGALPGLLPGTAVPAAPGAVAECVARPIGQP